MHQAIRTGSLLVAVAAFIGCQQPNGPAGNNAPATGTAAAAASGGEASGAPRLDPSTVVAKWSGGQMTYGELLELKSADFTKFERQKLTERHQLEQQLVEAHIVEQLVEAEAKKTNKTAQEYMTALVEAAEVTDADIQEFYDQRVKASGQPLDAVKDRIKQHLAQNKGREVIGKELERIKSGANLEIDVPAPETAKATFDLAGRPAKGPDNAKVTLIEFSDFECPYCARATSGVDEIIKAFPNDVKVVFLHFPLSFHKKAMPAALAAQCANKQNKFWEFHDKVFGDQGSLAEPQLTVWAKEIGLDEKALEACMADPATKAYVEADMKQGEIAGVQGTPSFFVNGVQQQGMPSVDVIKKAIEKGS